MTLINLPKTNQTGTNEWADVEDNDRAIVTVVNGQLTNENLSGSAGITNANLASPMTGTYRNLIRGSADTSATATGSYFLLQGGTLGGTSGGGGGTNAKVSHAVLELLAADYAVASLTTKLRVKMVVAVGSTSPSTVTFATALYPVTISSGNWTTGTVVSGSTATSSGLATNTASRFSSGDFTFPSDGMYALAVTIGSITVPSNIGVSVQLAVRNV